MEHCKRAPPLPQGMTKHQKGCEPLEWEFTGGPRTKEGTASITANDKEEKRKNESKKEIKREERNETQEEIRKNGEKKERKREDRERK